MDTTYPRHYLTTLFLLVTGEAQSLLTVLLINSLDLTLHTVPQADLGFIFCIKHSDHDKNFV